MAEVIRIGGASSRLSAEIEGAADLPSLAGFVYSKLSAAILTGKLRPGVALRQEAIASELNVSRLPVREALARLETEGVVVVRPRRGYVVAPFDPEEAEEIFDIRMLLEERAGYLAASNRTGANIREVESALVSMETIEISNDSDVFKFTLANREFHERLFLSSGQRQLCRVMLTLRNSVERYVKIGTWLKGGLSEVHKDHRNIFNAFRSGNPEETAELCREHVRRTKQRIVSRLKSKNEYIDKSPR